MSLPRNQKLVVVFTPNRQSLTGIQQLVKTATNYRRRSDDVRPLVVFPLPSRVETNLPKLVEKWRLGSQEEDIEGYQEIFQELFKKVYDLKECDLRRYFDEIQVQQISDYAFGEEIAALTERSASGRLSMTTSFDSFSRRLIDQSPPWSSSKLTLSSSEQPGVFVKIGASRVIKMVKKRAAHWLGVARPQGNRSCQCTIGIETGQGDGDGGF